MQASQAVEDYLKAIHSLGGDDKLVSPAEIAAELHVRGPSVTGMLKRLADARPHQLRIRCGARN